MIIYSLLFIIFFGFDVPDSQNATVNLSKTGPEQVSNGQNITYQLRVSYSNATSITVRDRLPDNVEFVSAGGPGNPTYDATTRTVTWTLTGLSEGGSGGSASGSGTEGYIPPNSETCNGKLPQPYDLSAWASGVEAPLPVVNFGDPECTATKDNIYNLLKEKDPTNADFWFNTVIPCESAYNPNTTFRCHANGECTPDPKGAWGLFQVGSGVNGPFKDVGTKGSPNAPNDIYDRGDVNWYVQVTNAIKLLDGRGWNYWACASSRW